MTCDVSEACAEQAVHGTGSSSQAGKEVEALKMLCDCAQAYYALAVALEQYGLVRSLPRDDLPTLPTSTTEPHRMLTQKLEKDCGVDSARLQNKTDIMVSPSSSLDDGTFH